MQRVLHHDAVWLSLDGGPQRPAHEPVDRIPALRLVEQQLMLPPVELVAAVLHPVRERDQNLSAAGGADLVGPVTVEDVAAARRVVAEPAADLHDHRTLVVQRDLELLARRSYRRHAAAVSCPE